MFATGFFATAPIDELYQWFAASAQDTSPIWGRLCRWIAETPAVSSRLDALPGSKRQPNLFLAAVRYYGGPTDPGPEFVAWVAAHWDEVEALIMARETQTNEVGRAAVLAPLIASLPKPISLLEVGCSAGLLLRLDAYRYRYSNRELGDGPLIECESAGAPPALLLPEIAARAGLDPNPLDPADPEDARWLRALVWPGEDAREARLVECLAAARLRPATVLAGNAVADLPRLLACAAPGTTPVVMHSTVLPYLSRGQRAEFVAAVRASGARWVCLEGPRVLEDCVAVQGLGEPDGREFFVLALDGEPVALSHHHGAWVRWL